MLLILGSVFYEVYEYLLKKELFIIFIVEIFISTGKGMLIWWKLCLKV